MLTVTPRITARYYSHWFRISVQHRGWCCSHGNITTRDTAPIASGSLYNTGDGVVIMAMTSQQVSLPLLLQDLCSAQQGDGEDVV